VSATGDVTGVSAGAFIITYYIGSGCFKTYSMSVSSYIMPVSGTYTVCAGANTTLSSATAGGVWTSGAPTVATIAPSTGLLTGVAAGTANIVYTLSGTGCSASKVITVTPLPDAITGPAAVCVGSTITMASTTASGTWLSSAGIYATVNAATGVVTGIAAGTVNISYANGFGCRTYTTITVNPLPAIITGIAVVNELSATTLACTTPGGSWSSSNPSVGTINAVTGVLTGITTGITTISYQLTATGCTRTRIATVNPFGSRATYQPSSESAGQASIFPSPTNGLLTVGTQTSGTLYVYTIEGKELAVYTITRQNASVNLPGNIAQGVYVCRFISETGEVTIARVIYNP
jgi:uncharacterized protein YjdB